MAEDPEAAIDKLAEYRASSKTNKNLDHESDAGKRPDEISHPVRDFFIQLYKFNAVLAAALGFATLFAGWIVYNTFVLWFPIALLGFGISAQIMRTIARLDKSDGRNTTIDDAFIIFVLMLGMFGFLPFVPIGYGTFKYIHVALVIVWFAQIYFVNYDKPDYSGYGTKGGIQEVEPVDKSFIDKFKEFMTRERVILFGIGFLLSIFLSIFPYSQL